MENTTDRIHLRIDGMHCDACVRRVRMMLQRAGATEIHDVEVGSADFSVDSGEAGAKPFIEALENGGFQASVEQ